MRITIPIVLIILLSYLSLECDAQECASYLDCENCTDVSGCGWCFTTDSCVPGNSGGPTGECLDYEWASCTAPGSLCANETDCESCASTPDCGWCGSTSECLYGGYNGPNNGTCDRWAYYQFDCSVPNNDVPCEELTSCTDCTSASSCGWCHTSDACFNGTYSGPFDSTCGQWDWTGTYCTADCGLHTDCGACTEDHACGWCWTNGTCQEGNSNGDFDGRCLTTDWDWTGANCTNNDGIWCVPVTGESDFCPFGMLPSFTCSVEEGTIDASTFWTEDDYYDTRSALVAEWCPLNPDLITSVYTEKDYCTVTDCTTTDDCSFLFAVPLCWDLCMKCNTEMDCDIKVIDGYVASEGSEVECADSFSAYWGSEASSLQWVPLAWLAVWMALLF